MARWIGCSPHFEKRWTTLWSPKSCVGTLGWCPWCVATGLRTGLSTGVRETPALNIHVIYCELSVAVHKLCLPLWPSPTIALLTNLMRATLTSLLFVLHLDISILKSWDSADPTSLNFSLLGLPSFSSIRKTFPDPPPVNGSPPHFPLCFSY